MTKDAKEEEVYHCFVCKDVILPTNSDKASFTCVVADLCPDCDLVYVYNPFTNDYERVEEKMN
jgi:hypothetical protein